MMDANQYKACEEACKVIIDAVSNAVEVIANAFNDLLIKWKDIVKKLDDKPRKTELRKQKLRRQYYDIRINNQMRQQRRADCISSKPTKNFIRHRWATTVSAIQEN